MAKNRQNQNGKSHVDTLPMTRSELSLWFDDVVARLYALERVQNSSTEFRSAVLDALLRYGYTWSHAMLAERWLELGKWHEYRRGSQLMITDFLPGKQELESIGELDELINQAARRIVASMARGNYIHINRVREMLSEVRIESRKQTLRERKTNIEKMWLVFRAQNEQIETLKSRQKRSFSWRFHPKFNTKLLPSSRKV